MTKKKQLSGKTMNLPMIKNAAGILTGAFLVLAVNSVAFGAEAPKPKEGKIQVFVSILPQAYFVERVGGTQVEVTVLVGPGQSPATYEPSPHDLAHLSDADIYFQIGMPFEKNLLEKIAKLLPDLHVIDTRAGITLRRMEDIDPHGDHEHGEGGMDPHIWLDPQLVKIQAATIADELKKLRPGQAAVFDQNLAAFQTDLNRFDARIAGILAPYQNRRFYVFHPSYGYFADRYGLNQVAVEISGKDPGARHLGELMEQAKTDGVHDIFAQAQFATGTAQAIAHEIGGEVVLLDPLSRDYINNLEQMAIKIARAFGNVTPVETDAVKKESHGGNDR